MGEGLSRRDFLRVVGIGSLAAGVVGAGLRLPACGAPGFAQTRRMMGTLVTIEIVGMRRKDAAAAVSATLDTMARLEDVLTRHRDTSQVSRLNRTGIVHNPHQALVNVLQTAEGVSQRTSGAFDVTIAPVVDLYSSYGRETPPAAEVSAARAHVDHNAVSVSDQQVTLAGSGRSISLDGIAKGYIVDEGAAVLAAHGCQDVLVEAGGDLTVAGVGPSGKWQVGVRPPRPGWSPIRLEAVDAALATSGDYETSFTQDNRHHHIIDPRTGLSNRSIASATVIARQAALADALATALMAMGVSAGSRLVDEWDGVEALLIAKDGEHHPSSGFYA